MLPRCVTTSVRSRAVLLAVLLALAGPSVAGRLVLEVDGPEGPAVDAAVLLVAPGKAALKPAAASIDQRNTEFTPLVSIVDVGSVVRFPNSDNVRHQVYSFSPAKRFQRPLYSGRQADPVTFDVPGIVELGCNIHDTMVAYVVVSDTPYHALTDARGRASVTVPAGRYTLRVWHPYMEAGALPVESAIDIGEGTVSRTVQLRLPPRAAPARTDDEKIRALQDKLKKLKRGP